MTPPNAKDGFEKVLARGLRGAADTPGHDCPDAEILAAHFERSLSAEESQRWEAHFSICTRCQEQLAALVRSEPAPEAARQPFRLLNWRWLTPLAAASAAALLWIVLQPSQPTDMATNRTEKAAESAPPAAAPAEPAATPAQPAATLADKVAPSKDGPAAPIGLKRLEESVTRSKPAPTPPPPPAERDIDAIAKEALKNKPQVAEGRSSVATMAEVQTAEKKAQDEFAARRAQGEREDQQKLAQNAQLQTTPATLEQEKKADQRAVPAAAPAPAEKRAPAQTLAQANEARDAQTRSKEPAASEEKNEGQAFRTLEMQPGLMGRKAGQSMEGHFATPGGKTVWRYAENKLERSTDAGRTWELSFSPPHPVVAGHCPKDKVCWAVGESGLVLRTADGAKWEVLPAPTDANLVSVRAKDEKSAIVTTAEGRSFQTSDAGKTWKPL